MEMGLMSARPGFGQIATAPLRPEDILTPQQLADRLQVSKSWVFEQTRNRAKVRNGRPLPCIRLGKYLRFSWIAVCEWMAQQNP
jgi:hypothetical protein